MSVREIEIAKMAEAAALEILARRVHSIGESGVPSPRDELAGIIHRAVIKLLHQEALNTIAMTTPITILCACGREHNLDKFAIFREDVE